MKAPKFNTSFTEFVNESHENGFLPLYEWKYAEPKDLMRIGDILKKSAAVADKKDMKALSLAKTMAKLIKDTDKSIRRARATQEMKGDDAWKQYQRQYGTVNLGDEERMNLLDLISAVFYQRAVDLGNKDYLKPNELEIVRGQAMAYDLGIL